MFFYIVLTPISTTSGLGSTGNTRKYQQIDVYIYQCECCALENQKENTMCINMSTHSVVFCESVMDLLILT